MNTYLENVVLPYYKHQSAVIDNFVLYDLNFKVIIASPKVLQLLNFNTQDDITGKSIADFGHINVTMLEKLQQIFSQVINNKQVIKFISIGGQDTPLYKNHYELILQSYTPIIDPDSNVVGVIATKLPTIGLNFINLFFPKLRLGVLQNHLLTESLTPREFSILYLLSNGLSQYEIADFLKVSRSTIVKTITDRILDKIGVDENNSERIIKKALQLGIYAKIPRSLVNEQIIILNYT